MLWKKNKNKLVDKFLKKNKEKLLKIEINIINDFLKNTNRKIFLCDPKFKKQLIKSVEYLDKYLKVSFSKFCKINSDEKKVLIAFNNEELLNIIKYLIMSLNDKEKKLYYDKLHIAKLEIEKSKSNYLHSFRKIQNLFPNSMIKPFGIEIYKTIFPTYYIYDKPPKIRKIPNNLKDRIDIIVIYTDYQNKINSVYIGNCPHPNSKDGWFCLGNLKDKELNLENVEKLIKNLKVYNLTDCYFIPEKFKKII
jgi:hypothetical protein